MSGAGTPEFICKELQRITDRMLLRAYCNTVQFKETYEAMTVVTPASDTLKRLALCAVINKGIEDSVANATAKKQALNLLVSVEKIRGTIAPVVASEHPYLSASQIAVCEQTKLYYACALTEAKRYGKPASEQKDYAAALLLATASPYITPLQAENATPSP